MRVVEPILVIVAAASFAACGDDSPPDSDVQVGRIGGIAALATYAYSSAGPEGLYDYLAPEVTARCSKEQLNKALGSDPLPTGFRQIKDVSFSGDNQAKGTVVLITKDGDKDAQWSFVREGHDTWRISQVPGLENCGKQ